MELCLGTIVHLRCCVSFFLLFCRCSVLVIIMLNEINRNKKLKKSVIAMESAHIDLHTKTLKLVDIEISRRTLLCFAWLVLRLIVNYNTRFSGLTNTWLKSDPHNYVKHGGGQSTLLTPSKLWE